MCVIYGPCMTTEQPFRTVTNLRKAGNLQEAWSVGFAALEQSPQDTYLNGALFWVCYDYIKQQQEPIIKRAGVSNNFRPSEFEFEKIENLLQTVVELKVQPGGLEYKMLLVQFKKSLEWFPTLVRCVLNHQAGLFDDESKQPYQAEKGEAPSLMLSIARQVASAWLRVGEHWQLDFNQVMALVNITREQVSDTQQLIWLDYDQAKCLVVAGEYEQSRALVLPILRKNQLASWAWGALATTYRKQDPELAIQFFAKGIISAHEVKHCVNQLRGIVPLLLSKQQQTEASMCLKRALAVYEDNGWKIKPELEQLSKQSWYDKSVDENLLDAYLKSISIDALDHLHGPTQTMTAIVENIHKSGKGFHAFVNKSTSLSVRIGLYKGKYEPVVGDCVELSVACDDGEQIVVGSTLSAQVEVADVSLVEGPLRISPKGFGFVKDTFVPHSLVGDIASETLVSAQQVMSWDKTKSRYSWKAIKLSKISKG